MADLDNFETIVEFDGEAATPESQRTATKEPREADATRRAEIDETSEREFVIEAMREYQRDIDADSHNIAAGREDSQFVVGDQWAESVRARRERAFKPVLTVNRLPAFVAQYVGSWLQSDITIRLLPSHGGSSSIAEVRQGIIRTITRSREAKHALQKAMENAYITGVGNFAVDLRQSVNDVFAKDVVIKTIPDPFAVVWDRASYEPTGSDAQHCFVMEQITIRDFKKRYPGQRVRGWVEDEYDSSLLTVHGHDVDDMIRLAHFWQMRYEPATLGLEAGTGDVIDLEDIDPSEYAARLEIGNDGKPVIAHVQRPYAECYVLASDAILEGPYRLDIPRLPVFRVEGWAIQEGAVKHRWGFVRNAKDPQRLHNYWRSVLAEELMKSPTAKWLLDKAGDRPGLKEQFAQAARSDSAVLEWDSAAGGQKPEQVTPPPVNAAVLTEAQMTVQDIKDVTNKHEASLGVTSNEVSGKAITARQRVSELGDVIYIKNMDAAVAEAGRVINELIPVVYDTRRVVKITGEDDVELLQEINGDDDTTPDVTRGKYEITFTTGPSYTTKRQEATDVILTLMNTMPQVGNVVADILVRNMDIPGAHEIEDRLAKLLPPGTIDVERLPARSREKAIQQQQRAEALQQQQQQIEQLGVQLQMAELQAKIAELQARAQKQLADAEKTRSEIGVEQDKSDNLELKALADVARAAKDIEIAQMDALKAGLEAAITNATADESEEPSEQES